MADINLRAQPLNVFGTVGDDTQIVLTVVDSAGDPIDVSGYTISAKVWRGATEVDEMTDAVSGASNNVITLSLTDTETTAIGTERGLRWSLSMTASSITEQWVGGKFELLNAGHPKASGVSAATLTYTSGDVTVTLGSISTTALDGRYLPGIGGAFRALCTRMESNLPAVMVVQGDSTGNETAEWPYLFTSRLAGAYTDHRVLYRLWNTTTLSYATPTVVQAATEPYYTPASDGAVFMADNADISITGDMEIRAKVRATDVNAAAHRTIAAIYGGDAASRAWRLYIDSSNGLTLNWQETGGSFRTAAVASLAQLEAAFDDGVDFYIGCRLDVDNGSSQYTVTGLTSADGVTWTTLGTPVTGSTGVSSVKDSTGYLKIGGRGVTGGNTDTWDGRIYWVELCSGVSSAAKIVDRFEPGLATRLSTFTSAEGHTWTMDDVTDITNPSPLLLVLNASSSGEDFDYSVTNFDDQAAIEPTVTLISYGHNGPTPVSDDYRDDAQALIDAWTTNHAYTPLVFMLQNPQVSPRTAAQIQDHADRVAKVAQVASALNYETVDAFSVLGGDSATYIDTDGVHPTAAGSQAWADEIWRHVGPYV